MSDTTATPADAQPTPAERSFGAEVVRESAISAASNAAGIAGVLGCLVLVKRFTDRKTRKAQHRADKASATETVTTES